MSLNGTVSAERPHIAFFGRRNAGKSSLVNAVTQQKLAVVSPVKGTTTDPVQKAMELLPLGPVVIIDTPGIDDEGALGELRVETTRRVLAKTDLAVLVVDATVGLQKEDEELKKHFEERKIPYLIAMNKADLLTQRPALPENALYTSAAKGEEIHTLREAIGALLNKKEAKKPLVADLLAEGDTVVLVIPIDESAPKGRLILPQQQTIRDILEAGCTAVCCRDTELPQTLNSLREPPKLVITDSQAFGRVSKMVPPEIPLTGFSVLFARYKGDLPTLVKGAAALAHLRDGDRVLISEGCTHHRQCNDIGTVKMPGWIKDYCGKEIEFSFTSGGEFPEDLQDFALVVHCGGCMLNEKEMHHRMEKANAAQVPMVNYGVAIAQMHGILKRSLEIFPDLLTLLD